MTEKELKKLGFNRVRDHRLGKDFMALSCVIFPAELVEQLSPHELLRKLKEEIDFLQHKANILICDHHLC